MVVIRSIQMKKILFINPVNKINVMKKSKALALPPYSFLVLASLTPDDVEVQIMDEAYEDINFDTKADLVGITCLTYTANRAYEISTEFRKRGIKTILGGVHPSMVPDEASMYADTVVIGEADDIWPEIVRDFQNDCLKPMYQAEKRPDISKLPPANRNLLKGNYFIDTIQTARGCPNSCKFCAVHRYNGTSYRYRDIDLVIREMEQLKKTQIMIVDDNILGRGQNSYKRALELFNRMKPLKKKWAAQTCINIADETEILKSAGDSGASIFLIGFESINQKSIEGFNKNVNLKASDMITNYEDSIKKIHDCGIAIIGSYMFGMDTDFPDTFERTVEFVMKNEIDAVQLCIATPYPGTAYYEEMKSNNRLVMNNYPQDWSVYNGFVMVFQPEVTSIDDLYYDMFDAYKAVSSFKVSLKRGLKTFKRSRNSFATGVSFFWNYGIYSTLKSVPQFQQYVNGKPEQV
jgi:radical SAM superfamily enzyme YgiQ (UPF0313 family)